MKIFSLSLLLGVAVLSLTACNKQYNDNIVEPPLVNPGGGSGSFNWTGTPPLSFKVDGEPFQVDDIMFQENSESLGIAAWSPDNTGINFGVPKNAVEGTVYSVPYPANIMFQRPQSMPLGSMNGKIKVVTNNATTFEGYFWADMKDLSGQSSSTAKITEGYFKITKP